MSIDIPEERSTKGDEVIRLLSDWMADERGYEKDTWPLLKEALDRERERIDARELFA